ncbi:ABC transporter substrate-binding protein [Devosia sp. XGJD_8]|uniref:ABC transporter substrate-binding protein n=1 Tax=Devosia sp. XGJD_8 TaxID=3391187 RepID=UPI00398561DF
MSDTTTPNAAFMSRKTFLRGVGAFGAAALIGKVGLFSGAAWAQEQAEGKSGGVLAYNLTGDPPNFDPLSATSSTVMCVIGPCYNGLVRFDPQSPQSIIGDLAPTWDISEDGLSYTFHLVENAKFHDGKPMTSADVQYTFDTIRNPPEGTVSSRKKLLAEVTSIDAPDAYTVVFNLGRPSPSFLTSMASCWMLVMPKHILEVKGHMKEDIVGTGPFKLQQISQGVSYELVKNPDYFVPNRPYLDGITAYVIPDSGTTWNYLQNGQLQIMISIQGQDAGSFKSGGNVEVLEQPSTSFIGINFNTKAAPFDNVKVRQALSIGVDRNAALNVTYNGQGQLGGIAVPGQWALPDDQLATVPGYGPDGAANIEKAKRLLAEAGFPDGFDVNILVRKNPLFEPVGVFLKDQWAKLGINATIDIQENAAYAEAISSKNYAVSASGASYALEDPDSVFGDDSFCGVNDCSLVIEDLFAQQAVEMDPAKRLALVNQLELELAKEYSIYVMYWRNRFMGITTNVRGMKLHPNIDQNLRMDQVWLDA